MPGKNSEINPDDEDFTQRNLEEKERAWNCKTWLKETFVDDKYFWGMIVVLLIANIWIH